MLPNRPLPSCAGDLRTGTDCVQLLKEDDDMRDLPVVFMLVVIFDAGQLEPFDGGRPRFLGLDEGELRGGRCIRQRHGLALW